MLFYIVVTVKGTKVVTFLEILIKKIDFNNVKQFLDNECSITVETLEYN